MLGEAVPLLVLAARAGGEGGSGHAAIPIHQVMNRDPGAAEDQEPAPVTGGIGGGDVMHGGSRRGQGTRTVPDCEERVLSRKAGCRNPSTNDFKVNYCARQGSPRRTRRENEDTKTREGRDDSRPMFIRWKDLASRGSKPGVELREWSIGRDRKLI